MTNTNKTSPKNGDGYFPPTLIPFILGQCNVSASWLHWWSKYISKILTPSPAEGRREPGSRGCRGCRGWKREAACNPPSITGTPIIKDKLQYTSLGYANSKLDASHQKSSIAIFCIDKSRMSASKAVSSLIPIWEENKKKKHATQVND